MDVRIPKRDVKTGLVNEILEFRDLSDQEGNNLVEKFAVVAKVDKVLSFLNEFAKRPPGPEREQDINQLVGLVTDLSIFFNNVSVTILQRRAEDSLESLIDPLLLEIRRLNLLGRT